MNADLEVTKIKENIKMINDKLESIDKKIDEGNEKLEKKMEAGFKDILGKFNNYVLKEVHDIQIQELKKDICENDKTAGSAKKKIEKVFEYVFFAVLGGAIAYFLFGK